MDKISVKLLTGGKVPKYLFLWLICAQKGNFQVEGLNGHIQQSEKGLISRG